MESRHVSRYYVKRRARPGTGTQDTTYATYPKVVFVVDCHSHLVLAAVPGRGPGVGPGAVRPGAEARRPAGPGSGRCWPTPTSTPSGSTSTVRSHGIRTIIPPTRGRPSDKPPAGRGGGVMKQRFARLKRKYGQRWQTETVNSMIKRRLGSALRARSYWSQCREIILRVITHNVMIVANQGFLQSNIDPLLPHVEPRKLAGRSRVRSERGIATPTGGAPRR